MKKDILTLFSFLLLTATILSCNERPAQLDWKSHYNEPTFHHWPTTRGDAELCIATPKSWNRQTWFFLHGAGGNIESYKGFVRQILRHRNKDVFPNIIAISIGPKWFLVDHRSDPEINGSTLFWKKMVPAVKQTVPELGKIVALGHSMGGFNALSIFADRPDFWNAVVLVTPAIADLSPYASIGEKEKYVKRTNRRTWKQWMKHWLFNEKKTTEAIDIILENWRQLAKNDKEWRLINPLYRLEETPANTNTRFFISCGKNDPFGFLEGSSLALKLLKDSGIGVESCFLAGGHMVIPDKKIFQFLDAL
jgi:predicted esterase